MPEDVYNQLVEVQTKFHQIISQYNLTIESWEKKKLNQVLKLLLKNR
jgi:hypothetical protein